jgi:hypothetical protein
MVFSNAVLDANECRKSVMDFNVWEKLQAERY